MGRRIFSPVHIYKLTSGLDFLPNDSIQRDTYTILPCFEGCTVVVFVDDDDDDDDLGVDNHLCLHLNL